jgi:hypothetical protein
MGIIENFKQRRNKILDLCEQVDKVIDDTTALYKILNYLEKKYDLDFENLVLFGSSDSLL